MHRRVIAAGWAVACLCGSAAAEPAGPGEPPPGEPPGTQPPPESGAPGATPPMPAETTPAPMPAPDAIGPASAPAAPDAPAADDTAEIGDQLLGGTLGLAAGGRSTAGGLRITGHYLYQLSSRDWFDGIASFTFGSGDPACFRDREDALVCDHGLADGGAIEVAAGVRRMFPPQGRFRPFVRAAVGIAVVRFSGDDLTGVAIPLHAGAGLRAQVADGVAVIALADATVGLGSFGRGLSGEPLFGLAVTAGAEVRLR